MKVNSGITATAVAAMLIGTSATAAAEHSDWDYYSQASGRSNYAYAKVLSAEPIIDYVTVKTPVQECWQETQYQAVDTYRPVSAGGTLLGAVIGGVVGHQFGSGRGNDAATVAGTLIGAAIGNDAAQRRAGAYGVEQRPVTVERCATRYQEHREERINGYRVLYRYQGQKYLTEMPYDPGAKIRVRVDVRPAG